MARRDLKMSTRVARVLLTVPLKGIREREVAKMLCCSESRMRHYLHREGVTFYRILAAVKLKRFQKMVRGQKVGCGKCYAYDLGFASASCFYRFFQVETGQAFSDFRRSTNARMEAA